MVYKRAALRDDACFWQERLADARPSNDDHADDQEHEERVQDFESELDAWMDFFTRVVDVESVSHRACQACRDQKSQRTLHDDSDFNTKTRLSLAG